MAYRLGVDIGGTFTDIVLIDETTGQVYNGKVSSTPDDPSEGFMEAVRRLVEEQAVALSASVPPSASVAVTVWAQTSHEAFRSDTFLAR